MRFIAPLALLLFSAVAAARQPLTFQLSDLGSFGCDPSTPCSSAQAEAISDTGSIAGYVRVDVCYHAALWRHGEWRELGALGIPAALGYAASYGFDVNHRNQVVGSSATSITPETGLQVLHAFLWEENAGMRDLGVLGVYRSCFTSGGQQVCFTVHNSEARAINDLGQVVGVSSSVVGPIRAFLWENGSMMDLGGLPGSSFSEAVDINNAGQVVGTSRRAFLWEDGVMTDLGSLDSSRPSSNAAAINNWGEVVGRSFVVEGGKTYVRGFIWRDGVMQALPPLPGDNLSEATGVNDRGQAIGISFHCDPQCGAMHPVMWDGEDVIDLGGIPDAGFYNKPTGLNDRGQVVGTTVYDTSPFTARGFLAQPH